MQRIDRYIAWPAEALSYKIGELITHRVNSHAAMSLLDRSSHSTQT